MGEPPPATVVATEPDVERAFERIAAGLQATIQSEDCVLLGVMMGGLLPLARLSALVRGDFVMDYCQVSRYRGAIRGGKLEWLQPPRVPLDGRTVVLIDDIFDEGITLDFVVRACRDLGAARVESAVLVRKRHDRAQVDMRPDHVGLEVGDHYVFGCGMDYQHRWRQLPAIYALGDDA